MTARLTRFTLDVRPGAHVVGDRLAADAAHAAAPGFVYLHGLGSVRDGEKSRSLLSYAAARGRGFTRFDFRGHGESSGHLSDLLLSDVIADGIAVLEEAGRSVLVGSSLGGLVASWVADARPELVQALVLLAPAFGFLHRLRPRMDAERQIVLDDGRSFPVAEGFLADMQRYDELALAARWRTPVLIVHGENDATVPVVTSRLLFGALRIPHKELWVVPGGDHRLNGPIAAILERMDAFLAGLP